MSYLKRYRKIMQFSLAALILMALSQVSPSSANYQTIHHWQDWPANVYYGIDSNFDTNLNVAGATNAVAYDVVPKWNATTWHHFTRVSPWNSNDSGITTWNQPGTTAPGCPGPLYDAQAITCVEPLAGSAHTKARIYLNTGTYGGIHTYWNNSGTMDARPLITT